MGSPADRAACAEHANPFYRPRRDREFEGRTWSLDRTWDRATAANGERDSVPGGHLAGRPDAVCLVGRATRGRTWGSSGTVRAAAVGRRGFRWYAVGRLRRRAPSTTFTARCSDRRSSAVRHLERRDVTRLAAELHPDQMDRLAPAPVPGRVSPAPVAARAPTPAAPVPPPCYGVSVRATRKPLWRLRRVGAHQLR